MTSFIERETPIQIGEPGEISVDGVYRSPMSKC